MTGKRGRPRNEAPPDFYGPVFSEKVRHLLAEAMRVEGLTQEIAAFRVRLRELLADVDADPLDIHRAGELLIKAIATSERLSEDDGNDVLERVTAELGGILELLADTPAKGGE